MNVGRVSNRKHARLHAATCRIVAYRHLIPATIRPLTADDAPLVCKHCRKALFAAAREAQVTANMRAGHSTTPNGAWYARQAALLVEALETPTDLADRLARDDAFRAQWRQPIDALTLAA